MVLGLLTIVSCSIVYTMVGVGSHSILKTNPTVAKLVGRVSGVTMIIVAIILITEQFIG